jgi:CRP-like cAMP-binding protein
MRRDANSASPGRASAVACAALHNFAGLADKLHMLARKQRPEETALPIGNEALRAVPLFRDFEPAELTELARLITTQRFGKHQTIFREGDPGQSFYLILSGSVAIVHMVPDGRETILSILKERDFFGEMSIFESALRAASVRTLTDVEVGIIDRVDFLALIDRSPRIGRLLVTALSDRLRDVARYSFAPGRATHQSRSEFRRTDAARLAHLATLDQSRDGEHDRDHARNRQSDVESILGRARYRYAYRARRYRRPRKTPSDGSLTGTIVPETFRMPAVTGECLGFTLILRFPSEAHGQSSKSLSRFVGGVAGERPESPERSVGFLHVYGGSPYVTESDRRRRWHKRVRCLTYSRSSLRW